MRNLPYCRILSPLLWHSSQVHFRLHWRAVRRLPGMDCSGRPSGLETQTCKQRGHNADYLKRVRECATSKASFWLLTQTPHNIRSASRWIGSCAAKFTLDALLELRATATRGVIGVETHNTTFGCSTTAGIAFRQAG